MLEFRSFNLQIQEGTYYVSDISQGSVILHLKKKIDEYIWPRLSSSDEQNINYKIWWDLESRYPVEMGNFRKIYEKEIYKDKEEKKLTASLKKNEDFKKKVSEDISVKIREWKQWVNLYIKSGKTVNKDNEYFNKDIKNQKLMHKNKLIKLQKENEKLIKENLEKEKREYWEAEERAQNKINEKRKIKNEQ